MVLGRLTYTPGKMMEPDADPEPPTEVEPFPLSPKQEDITPEMEELTPDEREKLLARKQEKDVEYLAKMQKWGKVALYAMFFPSFLSIITIAFGVWYVYCNVCTAAVAASARLDWLATYRPQRICRFASVFRRVINATSTTCVVNLKCTWVL